MFGLNNITLAVIAGLIISNIVTFGMYRWSENDFEQEKVRHETTKLEFENYKSKAAIRETQLKEASTRATVEGEKRLAEAKQKAEKLEKDLGKVIRENKVLNERVVSNELVRVLNSSITTGADNRQQEKTTQSATDSVDAAHTGTGDSFTEAELAWVIVINNGRYKELAVRHEALQEWAREVCNVAGCE